MPRLIARRSPIVGRFRAPDSKPETQRALIMAALAHGTSLIRGPLRSRETEVMIAACKALGAHVEEEEGQWRVTGVGRMLADRGRTPELRYIWSAGSALVARTFIALGSAVRDRFVVDGNDVLRGRPFEPLFDALSAKEVAVGFFDRSDRLPVETPCEALPGGLWRLATSVSSQYATALLIAAPFAQQSLTIALDGPLYSFSYISQTVAMMRRFGVPVEVSDDRRTITVPAGAVYEARDIETSGDWTSASYILGAAFVTRGRITVDGLDAGNLQGERAIAQIVRQLGGRLDWQGRTIEVDCRDLPDEVETEVDLTDCPNILPTVAALASTIGGRVRITGARLTQNHKSPRIEAMACELRKAGVRLDVLHDAEGAIDGLLVHGRSRHQGRIAFSSHGDHRIFMSLALFAMACEQPCAFADGESTGDSFPGFLDVIRPNLTIVKGASDERQLVEHAA